METTGVDATAIAAQISELTSTVATLAPAMLGVGVAIVGALIAKRFIFGSR